MSESQLATKVQEMLNEEKWTRAALGTYTVSNLKELDILLEEANREKAVDEIKALCEEHLTHTKTSIVALYFTGVIALMRQQIDDSAMVALIDLFADNKKWAVVEFVCQRMLDFGENKTALRRLAECYEADARPDEMYATWERLVRVDYEEAGHRQGDRRAQGEVGQDRRGPRLLPQGPVPLYQQGPVLQRQGTLDQARGSLP